MARSDHPYLARPADLVVQPTGFAELVQAQAKSRRRHTYLEDTTGRRRISYEELADAVAAWNQVFEHSGLGPGAVVALSVATPVEFGVCFIALLCSGRWVAPIDPALASSGGDRLATQLAVLGAEAVISGDPAPSGLELSWLDLSSPPPRRFSLTEHPRPAGNAHLGVAADGGGVVQTSSGTTGEPKVIALPAANLLHAARSVAQNLELARDDRGFSPLPLHHINAEVVGLLATLTAGSGLVLDHRFHRTGFWRVMADRGVTWINAVPAILSHLTELHAGESVPAGIRLARSASAPLAPVVRQRFEASTGVPVIETYGMTEAASQITANPLHGRRPAGSVGRAVGVELRIRSTPGPAGLDPAGLDPAATASGSGQVEIRGPSVITAYGSGRHAERFDAQGWLRTGDVGHLDEDGYLYLEGRIDDVINRGGEKMFPREIEEELLREPAVGAAAVVGRPDAVFGQVPIAYVVLRPDRVGTGDQVLADLQARLGQRLERCKQPAEYHVVDALPAGATGKVRRHELLATGSGARPGRRADHDRAGRRHH